MTLVDTFYILILTKKHTLTDCIAKLLKVFVLRQTETEFVGCNMDETTEPLEQHGLRSTRNGTAFKASSINLLGGDLINPPLHAHING